MERYPLNWWVVILDEDNRKTFFLARRQTDGWVHMYRRSSTARAMRFRNRDRAQALANKLNLETVQAGEQ